VIGIYCLMLVLCGAALTRVWDIWSAVTQSREALCLPNTSCLFPTSSATAPQSPVAVCKCSCMTMAAVQSRVVLRQHELRMPLACLLGWFADSASCLSVGFVQKLCMGARLSDRAQVVTKGRPCQIAC
jgi:hypothetical protein